MSDDRRHIRRLQQVAPAESAITTAVESCTCPNCGRDIHLDETQPVIRLIHAHCPHCTHRYLIPGRVDEFVLLDRIRIGANKNLYQAQNLTTNSRVAIRFLPDRSIVEASRREKLQKELRAFLQLNNVHLPRVFDLRVVDQQPFLITELVFGETADARLKQHTRLPEIDALRLAHDVADGISALHNAGLIHGNITPNSVVIDSQGICRLANHGLLGIPRRDQRGGIHGTPLFIAPEVLKGGPDTPRSDVYSLGVMLYLLLTGQPPFEGKTLDDVLKAQMLAVSFPIGEHVPTLNSATREIVRRAMKRNPADRYADGQAIGDDIRAALCKLSPPAAALPAAPLPAKRLPVASWHAPRIQVRPGFRYAALATVAISLLFWWLSIDTGPLGCRNTSFVRPSPGFSAVSAGAVATCTYPLEPNWQDFCLGTASTRGITFWKRNALMFSGVGNTIGNTYDNCRYMCTSLRSPYIISIALDDLTAEDPSARAGILVRANLTADSPAVFFGCTAKGELLLMCRSQKGTDMQIIRSRVLPHSALRPLRLRLECNANRYRACVKTRDGDWLVFGYCQADILWRSSKIGLAVASGSRDKLAAADISDIRILVPFQ
ncbi:MAG: protein kinase domain-containing protein [Kiritimatiellia bacterium]